MLHKKIIIFSLLLGSCVSYSSKKPSYLDNFKSAFRKVVERDQGELDQRFIVWGVSSSRKLQEDSRVRKFLKNTVNPKERFITGKSFAKKVR